MLLHVGDDLMIRARDIVLMLDLTRAGQEDTCAFMDAAQAAGIVRRISQEPPKTAVLTQSLKGQALYLSPISSTTLLKRVGVSE